MVRVTIFIEGDFPNLNPEAQTIGSNSSFREGFHSLFSGVIDLDGPKKIKGIRLSENYSEEDWTRIFFMIQEMEAWILSQPDKIEIFGKNKRLIRKNAGLKISESPKLKDKLIEEIVKPSKTLNRIFKDYFETKKGDKTYSKTKDGPDLIELLDSKELYQTFDEFKNLITKIHSTNDPQ
jgi:hypothetical protein